MFSRFECASCVVRVRLVRGSDINRVDLSEKALEVLRAHLHAGPLAERLSSSVKLLILRRAFIILPGIPSRITDRIERKRNAHAGHILRLLVEAGRDPARPDDAQLHDGTRGIALLRRGDVGRPVKIHHPAVLVQVVELAAPVRALDENIHAVALDILDLLPEMVLDDDLVRETGPADIVNPGHNVIHEIQLAACLVEMLRRHPDDQIIAQRLRPLQQAVMPLMKQVKCSVRDYLRHSFPLHSANPVIQSCPIMPAPAGVSLYGTFFFASAAHLYDSKNPEAAAPGSMSAGGIRHPFNSPQGTASDRS